MSLTEALQGVAGYDPARGREQPAQKHLAVARGYVAAVLPPLGYRVRSSGSGQSLPKVPWIAVLDQDVTRTAQQGLYVVYLYDVTASTVYLTLNQGATAHQQYYREHPVPGLSADRAALQEISAETLAIREELGSALLAGTLTEISLGSNLYLPRGYEAGSIAALGYLLAALPSERTLRDDLNRFLTLYGEAVTARSRAIAKRPSAFHVGAALPPNSSSDGEFKPKDSADYIAWVAAHMQKRSRKHEELVNQFAVHAQAAGWTPVTKGVHPRDLVLRRDGHELLIEAKTVGANSEHAVRDAIGQLFAYEYLYHPHGAQKVALFSAPVGDLWLDLLATLGVDAIWHNQSSWMHRGASVGWV